LELGAKIEGKEKGYRANSASKLIAEMQVMIQGLTVDGGGELTSLAIAGELQERDLESGGRASPDESE